MGFRYVKIEIKIRWPICTTECANASAYCSDQKDETASSVELVTQGLGPRTKGIW